jgi:hypothetical protein
VIAETAPFASFLLRAQRMRHPQRDFSLRDAAHTNRAEEKAASLHSK